MISKGRLHRSPLLEVRPQRHQDLIVGGCFQKMQILFCASARRDRLLRRGKKIRFRATGPEFYFRNGCA